MSTTKINLQLFKSELHPWLQLGCVYICQVHVEIKTIMIECQPQAEKAANFAGSVGRKGRRLGVSRTPSLRASIGYFALCTAGQCKGHWGEPERAPQLLVSVAPACVRVYVRVYEARLWRTAWLVAVRPLR